MRGGNAYGFAVAVSQRAEETLCRVAGSRDGVLAVGLLDELSVPDDPDPDHTEQARQEYPRYSAADTRAGCAYRYGERLAEAGLTLLRLPPSGDPDRVLDQVADGRRNWNRPTLVASRHGAKVPAADQLQYLAHGERAFRSERSACLP